jgi:hypothetical protein
MKIFRKDSFFALYNFKKEEPFRNSKFAFLNMARVFTFSFRFQKNLHTALASLIKKEDSALSITVKVNEELRPIIEAELRETHPVFMQLLSENGEYVLYEELLTAIKEEVEKHLDGQDLPYSFFLKA